MFCSDVSIAKSLRFLSSQLENCFRVRAQGHFDGGGDTLASSNNFVDFITDFGGLKVEMTQQCSVFPQKGKQDMFRIDRCASILAGFVAGEEDDATGFVG